MNRRSVAQSGVVIATQIKVLAEKQNMMDCSGVNYYLLFLSNEARAERSQGQKAEERSQSSTVQSSYRFGWSVDL